MSMVPTTQDKINSLKRERDGLRANLERVVAERDGLRRCVQDLMRVLDGQGSPGAKLGDIRRLLNGDAT